MLSELFCATPKDDIDAGCYNQRVINHAPNPHARLISRWHSLSLSYSLSLSLTLSLSLSPFGSNPLLSLSLSLTPSPNVDRIISESCSCRTAFS